MFVDYMFCMAVMFIFFSSFYSFGSIFMEMSFLVMKSFSLSLSLEISSCSYVYSSVILLVFLSVYMFCLSYFSYKINITFLIYLVIFVVSMELLVFSSNFFTMFVAWDGLGITSYYLVSYYFDSISVESGLVTFLLNRLGDSLIMVSISVFLLYPSFMSMGFTYMNYWVVFVFLVGLFTSSAQFPFNSWLPVAMSAPTPVSSLVHSSTLVTAGLLVLVSMNSFSGLFLVSFFCSLMGLFTMFIGGFMAVYSLDLKSLVAYSTLSQLGMISVSYGLGFFELSSFHMIVHAFFKSLMFIMVGVVMMGSFLVQDIRLISYPNLSGSLKYFISLCSLFNLMGVPLTAGWVSKDSILESFEDTLMGSSFNVLFWLCCCLTIPYSVKIIKAFSYDVGFMAMKFNEYNSFFIFLMSFVSSFFLFIFFFVFSDLFILSLNVGSISNFFNLMIYPFSLFLYCLLMIISFSSLSFLTFGLNFPLISFVSKSMNLMNFLMSFVNGVSKSLVMFFVNNLFSSIMFSNFVVSTELIFLTFFIYTIFG